MGVPREVARWLMLVVVLRVFGGVQDGQAGVERQDHRFGGGFVPAKHPSDGALLLQVNEEDGLNGHHLFGPEEQVQVLANVESEAAVGVGESTLAAAKAVPGEG